jgi:alpha-glucosidase
MKRLFPIFLFIVYTLEAGAQRSFQLYSPDSSLRLEIKIDSQLSYHLFTGNQLLVSSPSVDLALAGGRNLSGKIVVVRTQYNHQQEIIRPPVPYRKAELHNNYNQLRLTFQSQFGISFRMYNEGMAYRLSLGFKDSVYVTGEVARFDIDPAATAWYGNMNKRPDADRYHTSFEAIYTKQKLSLVPDTMLTFAPVSLVLPSGYCLAISDANLDEYPGMFLEKTATGLRGAFAPYPVKEKLIEGEYPQYVVTERADYIARTKGQRELPWRAILVGRSAIDLPVNDLVYMLADPAQISDVSWIKYGKGTDEWITGINLFDVPFVAGLNTASYKYYIDFARRFGFDQVMLDAGWSNTKDLFRINPSIDMEELLRYSREKHVRLMLWTLSSTLDRQLDSALQQFSKWGIASIMTDFMDRDDQAMVSFYHRVAKACAEHKISIMFHGAYPPKGFNRTWPNVLTHESVLGSEWNIWSELATPEHNVSIAYTRMLAGPLDYEPGLLQNAQKDQFRTIGKNPMSQGTRCHQLAMFVVYDSPLQIFSGNISQGFREPAFMELLGSIPTTWDDTKILQGRMGEYIVTARKKGDDWYVACLNNSEARDIDLPLSLLDTRPYDAMICKDGVNAHSYAADYTIEKLQVAKDDHIKIHVAPGGGFLLKLLAK